MSRSDDLSLLPMVVPTPILLEVASPLPDVDEVVPSQAELAARLLVSTKMLLAADSSSVVRDLET